MQILRASAPRWTPVGNIGRSNLIRRTTSVGYNGLPNVLRQVELDASIMDGRTLGSSAVCAVHNYEHVITSPRK
jgi:hypothetical protein